jgi:opacity protein-like surface antigen
MRIRGNSVLTIILLGAVLATPAFAQNKDSRDAGWEFGLDLNYLLGSNIKFDGGSVVDVDDDIGIAVAFGYRVNPRFEVGFTLDWASVDYDANLQSATFPGTSASVRGEMEAFTLMAKGVFNFIDGPVTPFLSASGGWSWIDTNIPNGPTEIGCWWDPWYGQICAPYTDTASADTFVYGAGIGVRWDIGYYGSMRFSYEMHWGDFDHADGSPEFEQFRLGYVWRY